MKTGGIIPRVGFTTLLLVLPFRGAGHTIPDDIGVEAYVKPVGKTLFLMARVPFDALADIPFATRGTGELDLPAVKPILPDAARTWIADWIDLYEGKILLPKPRVVHARVSRWPDYSFASYDQAWAHVTGSDLPDSTQVFSKQAMLDVLLAYSIESEQSEFAIHSRLARLGVSVVTTLRYVAPPGAVHKYEYRSDPGLFELDPTRRDAIQRFATLGFLQTLNNTDYLLFLFCAALLFRSYLAALPFAAAFTAGHSITLIVSAYDLAPEALWFPVLFETLIAISLVYIAVENIATGTPARYRWMVAFGFGLAHGFSLSVPLRQALQFGGSHGMTSAVSFNAGLELGQLTLFLLLIPALNLLFRSGVPERIGTIFLAALAAHTGWHRMIDRAQWLSSAEMQWPTVDTALVMRWGMISVLIAVAVYGGALWTRAGRRTTRLSRSA